MLQDQHGDRHNLQESQLANYSVIQLDFLC